MDCSASRPSSRSSQVASRLGKTARMPSGASSAGGSVTPVGALEAEDPERADQGPHAPEDHAQRRDCRYATRGGGVCKQRQPDDRRDDETRLLLRREPDPEGLAYYTSRVREGISLDTLCTAS